MAIGPSATNNRFSPCCRLRSKARWVLVTVASTIGLALIPTAVIVWQRHMLSITERVTMTALAVAAPVLLWWLNYWNLFGFML